MSSMEIGDAITLLIKNYERYKNNNEIIDNGIDPLSLALFVTMESVDMINKIDNETHKKKSNK